jgi:hypothetical protein
MPNDDGKQSMIFYLSQRYSGYNDEEINRKIASMGPQRKLLKLRQRQAQLKRQLVAMRT